MRDRLARFYKKIISLASHPYAVGYLALLSFCESCFLPITPMLILLPMVLATPQRMWRYITIATIAAILGSMTGYALGNHLIHWAEPFLGRMGYFESYLKVRHWFHEWGIFALLPTSVLPLPYKLFTISAGALGVPFLPFIGMTLFVRFIHFSWLPMAIRLARHKPIFNKIL